MFDNRPSQGSFFTADTMQSNTTGHKLLGHEIGTSGNPKLPRVMRQRNYSAWHPDDFVGHRKFPVSHKYCLFRFEQRVKIKSQLELLETK